MANDTKNIFLTKYRDMGIPVPSVHFVLGSLMGSVSSAQADFPEWESRGRVAFADIPGLSQSSAPSHTGCYEYFYHREQKKSICFQLGRLHGYEGLTAREVARTVTGPCSAGTGCFVLTNISGGLRSEFAPGLVVAVTDHINFTGQSPLVGLSREKPKDFYFPDMKKAYNQKVTADITKLLQARKLKVREGVYIGVLGPQFETPAEVRVFANYGADVVGMSTVWEVIALHYARARVAVFSVVANPACGVGDSVEIDPEVLKPCFANLIKSFFTFAQQP